MRKLEKREWSVHDVIVTVYEESSTISSRPRRIKTKHSSKPTTRSCGGYDRRADLLAYAHQLRNAGLQQDHNTPTDSHQPKPKRRKRRFGRLKALKFSFGRLFGRRMKKEWKYENIDATRGENIHRSCPSRCRGRNRWSKTSARLRRVLKQFSCGCKRSFHNDEQLQDLHIPHHNPINR